MNINSTAINPAPNEVRRFILENQPVRGYWVDLDSAWRELRVHQHYTPAVQNLLGEAVSASVLLAATLKFDGTLTLQLEGKGDVRLLVAQCTNDFKVRAVARLSDETAGPAERAAAERRDQAGASTGDAERQAASAGENPSGENSREVVSGVFDLGPRAEGSDPFLVLPKVANALAAASFRQLVGENGRVIVTIEGGDSGMRYQGIVPLDGDSLAECLERYFASSEQLPTRVRLAANDGRTVGLLLQKLPEQGGAEVEEGSVSAIAWQDAERAIAAVGSGDLLSASLQSLLEERFGQRDVRVFKGSSVEFSCRCSQARVAGLLRSLGVEEVRDVLREQGAVEVTCEFCQRPYKFDAFAVEQLFAPGATPAAGQSVH
ncbi:MAG: Hsp33 family molecular chaperone HslO [Gammaproteobacteria bacterium]